MFEADSFRDALPQFLTAIQAERERLRAAEDSQTLEYQVRNYFPHPLALRRERTRALPHGEQRVVETLECGEHLVTLLALLSLVQLGERPQEDTALPSKQLRDYCGVQSLALDWGKCIAVLLEATAFTASHPNPLVLPFPQLGSLNEALLDPRSSWSRADRLLRQQRNDRSHLHRLPPHEIDGISKECSRSLDSLIGASRFIAGAPLAVVADYSMEPVSGRRTAVFHLLQGSSPIFASEAKAVHEEVARGAVGIFGEDGEFRPLAPWMSWRECPRCKRRELFVFNRYTGASVTYIAMETGHPAEDPRAAETFRALIPDK